jgi:hypothetical protein
VYLDQFGIIFALSLFRYVIVFTISDALSNVYGAIGVERVTNLCVSHSGMM